jgi:hypothetical protein
MGCVEENVVFGVFIHQERTSNSVTARYQFNFANA